MLRLVLHIKKRASSNLNADRSKFLANKIARLVLGYKYYSDKFATETKLENCILLLEKYVTTKNWSPRRYRMPKPQEFFEKRWIYQKEKAFVKSINDFFFRIGRILSKTFLKKTISILSIHLHPLEDALDK